MRIRIVMTALLALFFMAACSGPYRVKKHAPKSHKKGLFANGKKKGKNCGCH